MGCGTLDAFSGEFMKRSLFFLTILALMVGCAACSASRQEFIIANETDEDLIIQYSYIDKTRIVYKPRVTAADKVDDVGKKWREIPTKFFDVDGNTRMVSVKIEPHEALLLNTEENYTGPESNSFPINMLSLIGKSGNKLFQNEDVQTEFTKDANGNYVLIYK